MVPRACVRLQGCSRAAAAGVAAAKQAHVNFRLAARSANTSKCMMRAHTHDRLWRVPPDSHMLRVAHDTSKAAAPAARPIAMLEGRAPPAAPLSGRLKQCPPAWLMHSAPD